MSELTTFLETWMAAVERGEVDAIADMCTQDVELSSPQGDLRGRDQVRAMFRAWVDGFSERQHPISNTLEAGDSVVAEYLLIGTHTGPMPSPRGVIPPTGKSIRVPSIAIYELRDGKLARSRGQFDQLTFLAQLGLLPEPAHH